MTDEIKKIQAELKDTRNRERDLKAKLDKAQTSERQARQKPLRALAKMAHNLLCPYNHTDGCSWGYENDSWESQSHRSWLDKIEKVVSDKATIEEVEEVLDRIAEIKAKSPNWRFIMRSLGGVI